MLFHFSFDALRVCGKTHSTSPPAGNNKSSCRKQQVLLPETSSSPAGNNKSSCRKHQVLLLETTSPPAGNIKSSCWKQQVLLPESTSPPARNNTETTLSHAPLVFDLNTLKKDTNKMVCCSCIHNYTSSLHLFWQ